MIADPDRVSAPEAADPAVAHAAEKRAKVPAARFSVWAFLFGPLYYLRFRLWRKGVLWLLLWAVPVLLPDDGAALARIVSAAYPGANLSAAVLSPVFLLLLFSGRPTAALLTATVACCGLLYGAKMFACLDLGVADGFIWLISRRIWPAAAAALFFYTLRRNLTGLALSAAAVLLLLRFGLPVQGFSLPLTAEALLRTAAGLAAPRDRRLAGR